MTVDIGRLKRNLNVWLSEQQADIRFWTSKDGNHDVHYEIATAKAQAFSKVLRCIENMETSAASAAKPSMK